MYTVYFWICNILHYVAIVLTSINILMDFLSPLNGVFCGTWFYILAINCLFKSDHYIPDLWLFKKVMKQFFIVLIWIILSSWNVPLCINRHKVVHGINFNAMIAFIVFSAEKTVGLPESCVQYQGQSLLWTVSRCCWSKYCARLPHRCMHEQ